MYMKKRNQILAGVLAVLLGVSPSGVYGEAFYDVEDVADTDAAAQEITDVQDEESEQPEEVTAGEEGQEIEFTAGINPEAEENLFTDHADTNVQDPQEGTILEYVEEELDSPLIVNGEPGDTDGIHVFSLEEYDGSYGNQLDGMALEVYNTYVSNLFVNYSTFNGVSYEYQASKPVTFKAKVQDNQLVQDEAYDEAILQVRVNMQAALDAFTYDYPEVFWMRGSGYSYSISSKKQNGKYTGVISKFTMKPSLVDGYNTNITDNMNNFLKNADAAAVQIAADTNGKSLYEKVKAIHDYVCEKAVYDAQNNLRVHSAGPMFIGDGHVVCEGYAKTMLILCRKLGIDCACIGGFARNSSASSGEAHMWNYVKMDNDTWYLVDATWDDQLSGIRTTYLLAGWNSKGFNHNTLREERTEKDTFSSPTEFTPQAFIYPLISDNSYLTDTETSPGHQLSKTDSKAATCTEAGNTEYWYCSVCKKYFSDEDEKKEISLADTVIPATGHQLSKRDRKAATCTEAGNTEYWYCSVCKKYFSDEAGTKETTLVATVVPATGHQLSKTEGKAATCTEAGNTEYWNCNICGKYFSDEAGTKETTLAATVVPATGHHYGEYQLTKEATALEEGVRTAYCSCGAYVTVTVPALTPSIKLNVSSLRLRVKQKYTVKVTGLAKGDSVVAWSTGNKKIARVSQKGVVTGKARGNTIITIRLASGYTKKIRVYVQKGLVKTTALKISNARLTLKKGRSYTLRTTVAPVTSQEKVTFKSSNSKVVSVNPKGKIYAKKKGRARITVRSGKKSRVCVVTVE